MAHIFINGQEFRIPIVRLDGKDYSILGGTYQVLKHEKIITDRYTKDGSPDRQKQNTNANRWKMTFVVPTNSSYITVQNPLPGESFDFGDTSTLLASDDKVYPYDGLYFYDITANEIFSGSYTSYVYMRIDWQSPHNNSPFVFQIPIELWGRDV